MFAFGAVFRFARLITIDWKKKFSFLFKTAGPNSESFYRKREYKRSRNTYYIYYIYTRARMNSYILE